MAEKVNYLLGDKERLKLFKSQAYQTSKKFDIKKIISLYESVYNDALKTYSG